MIKLPINLLLYVAILGLLGGSGYQFLLAVNDDYTLDQQRTRKVHEDLLEKGAARLGQDGGGPLYDNSPLWEKFATANFTGKEPPAPVVEPTPDENTQADLGPQIPLEEIFALICIVYDGDQSRAVIRYKDGADVEPPPEMAGRLSSGASTVPQLTPGRPGPGRPGPSRRGPQVPSFANQQGLVQHLELEDTLWKRYDYIRFVRVADDASHAYFVREDPNVEQKDWKEETLYPEVLDLPQEVLAALSEGGVDVRRTAVREDVKPEPSGWVPSDETTQLERNRFNIGNRDRELFQRDPNRIFNQDIGTANYRSPNGTTRGVRITSIAKGYERFGVQEGEIITAINGNPVGSKTEAIKVGKRLYRRGVRTFNVEFLSRGRSVTRTYVAPDE
jgi:hypothetical protein